MQGRLNQWTNWARAQGPDFVLFEGPPTGCGEIKFFKLIVLLLMIVHDRTNTSSAYLVNLTVFALFLCCAGIVADNGAITTANFLPQPSQISAVRETRKILSSEGPRSAGGGCPGPQCR